MGRVYEALKRAAEQNGPKAGAAEAAETREEQGITHPAEPNGNGRSHAHAAPEAGHAPEYLFSASRHFQTPETAHTTAPNEQTLASGGSHSQRESFASAGNFGARFDAHAGFVAIDVSARRVETKLAPSRSELVARERT